MGKRIRIGELLVDAGLIDNAQLAAAFGEQKRWGRPLGTTLVQMGLLEEARLIQVLAEQLDVPVARLEGKRIAPEVVELLPLELADKYRCLPLFLREQDGRRSLYLAMEDPSDLDVLNQLSFRLDMKISPVLVAPSDLEDALQRHYSWNYPASGASPLPLRESEADEPKAGALELDVDESSLDVHPLFTEVPAEPAPLGEAAPSAQADVTPTLMLRALAQLLVEKGIVTREELVERVNGLSLGEGDGDL